MVDFYATAIDWLLAIANDTSGDSFIDIHDFLYLNTEQVVVLIGTAGLLPVFLEPIV